jgi:hypothetical protein
MNGNTSSLARERARPASCHEIMIFDDGSDFAWIAELEADMPQVCFRKLPSFEDVDAYLNDIELGHVRAPEVLAIDVHCAPSEAFALLVPDQELQQNKGGFQLYELVFRKQFRDIDSKPTIFFTSWFDSVNSFEAAQLAKRYGPHIVAGSRNHFREKLLKVCLDLGWVDEAEARLLADPAQETYVGLFESISEELRFTAEERCTFLGLVSRNDGDIAPLLRSTALANERIDDLLAVSVLLDQLVSSEAKRGYLLEEYEGDRRLADLLVSGAGRDLTRLKVALEKRVGGRIL